MQVTERETGLVNVVGGADLRLIKPAVTFSVFISGNTIL